jgi:hypothetical protein
MELLVRFIIGGLVVSAFAVTGDLLKPKSFAGIFGAAPSVALATLGLTIAKQGAGYAAIEGRSMMLGAVAFCLYSHLVSWLLLRVKASSLVIASASIFVWLAAAFGLWAMLLR